MGHIIMTYQETRTDWYKWAVVGMLWFVCMFNYADRQGISSIFPLLHDGMGLTDIQLGILSSAFMWVYAGSGWLAGLISDRVKRKSVILGAFFFWSFITLSLGFAANYNQLVILRAIQGLGEAFYFPAAMAFLSAYHSPKTRSRAMAIHQSGVYAGTIVGGTLSGAMGQHYGWRSSFYLFGFAGIFIAIFLFFYLKEPKTPVAQDEQLSTPKKENLSGILKTLIDLYRIPMVGILTLVFIGANFVAAVFLVWLPKFLFDKFHLSLTMAGFSSTAYLQVGSVLGVLAGGWLADRLVQKYRGGRMMAQSLGLLLGVPFVFIVGWTLNMYALIMAMTCFGFFKGMYDANIWASLHDVVPVERRSTAVGIMNSLGWLSGGCATLFTAYASKSFGMSACISATSMIYLFFGMLLIAGIFFFFRGEPPVSRD